MFDVLIPAQEGWMSETADDLSSVLMEYMQASAAAQREITRIGTMMRELRQLQVLQRTIKTKGATESLLAFANHTGSLTRMCPHIPAVEALSGDLSQATSKAAAEGLLDTIATAIGSVVQKIKEALSFFWESIKIRFRSLDALKARVERYGADIAGKTFNAALAATIKIQASEAQHTYKRLADAKSFNTALLKVLALKLPLNAAEYQAWYKQMETILAVYLPQYGAGHHARAPEHGYVKGVLTTGKYDAKSFDILQKGILAWIAQEHAMADKVESEFNRLAKEADRLMDAYTTTSTSTSTSTTTNPDGTKTTTIQQTVNKTQFEAAMSADAALTDLITYASDIDVGIYQRTILNSVLLLGALKLAYV